MVSTEVTRECTQRIARIAPTAQVELGLEHLLEIHAATIGHSRKSVNPLTLESGANPSTLHSPPSPHHLTRLELTFAKDPDPDSSRLRGSVFKAGVATGLVEDSLAKVASACSMAAILESRSLFKSKTTAS